MKKSASAWSLAGLVAGVAGLATSYLVAMLMNMRLAPLPAVAELIRDLAPSSSVEWAKRTFGTADKPLLLGLILVILLVLFAVIGRFGRQGQPFVVAGYAGVAVVGIIATLHGVGTHFSDLVPIAVGFVTMVGSYALIADRLRRLEDIAPKQRFEERYVRSRRHFLVAVGAISVVAAFSGFIGRFAGAPRRDVDQERRLSRLPFTQPIVPAETSLGVVGSAAWMTRASDFYLIDTAFAKPILKAVEWELRIHGMVEREVVLTYEQLLEFEHVEGWVTLNCVSNEVGGDLVGNAWWSGVLLKPILEMAGPLEGADAVLQTSSDGWSCGTPLAALTDDRKAMLALYMNGEALPIDHGYPVRTVVPGLYGYVSATKWVVDMEVSRFNDFDAFWTQQGWGELGPVKMASRIEVPRAATTLSDAQVTLAGTAWHQHIGIEGVEVAVDGGAWQPAEIAMTPSDDSWVQWRLVVELPDGDHTARVRATNKLGEVQTGARADVLPDGATGWDEVRFTVSL